jgi:uncharacterized protein YhdP
MASKAGPESEFDRLARQIAELDLRESELLNLTPSTPETELALAGVQEQRKALKEELAALWSRRTNRC